MFKTSTVECKICKGTGYHKRQDFKNNWYLLLFMCMFIVIFASIILSSIWIVNTYHPQIEEFLNLYPIKYGTL